MAGQLNRTSMSTSSIADSAPVALTGASSSGSSQKSRFSSAQVFAVGAALLAVIGLTSIWSTVLYLWALWTTDALKSIGMVIPVVSAVLIFRAWRSLDYEMEGTWWGAILLAVTILAVHLREQAVLVFILTPAWNIYIPPHSLVAFAYTAGVVLLLGGTRLFRAALFPIVLMWFVNPIPHIFNVFVDLPLQRVSAHVARVFAIALGQPLSPDQMRLMFTPDFGMFIAPGCNGIRGAVTMGFIALIAGYIYRFRWYAHATVVAGAVLLGYVFNFVRLCILVLYYIVALHFTWLRSRAEMGDYIIGAALFLVATILLFAVISRLRSTPGQLRDADVPASSIQQVSPGSLYPRLALLLVIAILGSYSVVRAGISNRQAAASFANTDQHALGVFPQQIGTYTLVRSWNENLITGPLIFHWAEYAPTGGGAHISLGISPVLGSHDTLICHSARGEDPLWHDQLTFLTEGQRKVSFSGSFYNDGATQFLEATTLCNGTVCGEYSTPYTAFGFVYSKPDPNTVFSQDPIRPIPILLRAETIETTMPADAAREQMTTAVRTFLAAVNLNALTQPYRRSSKADSSL
jgi:exosortase J